MGAIRQSEAGHIETKVSHLKLHSPLEQPQREQEDSSIARQNTCGYLSQQAPETMLWISLEQRDVLNLCNTVHCHTIQDAMPM